MMTKNMNLFVAGALAELAMWHATEGKWWMVSIDIIAMLLNLLMAVPSTRGVK